MIFYRLTKSVHANEAWTGYGAKKFGGRWNHKGNAAVYVSGSIALAALEIYVHAPKETLLEEYRLFSIEIADEAIDYLQHRYLPDDWRRDPAPISTMDIGSGWLSATENLALIIPSCIIPHENNAIINPNHPDFPKFMGSIKELDFTFDQRLMG
ncbi:RES family NAD+ phosphorylase [Xenorhabdus szentirmaii]|uniref:Toxin-antitoxin system, toxin component n=1 Tax=Xenorhabdus szentirmaii DSM 16338 TaxID=1427518 RepID=W1J2N1_9GAMM|nr:MULTISPECIES: RES domain-containing protein [Xenorhabdus]MBD2780284.1 RES domain-containing protein [Xenorhabdus sp. 38]MBD2790741.1 RES domain-containing protein [Xenorhabdus sp. CUL]MBD2804876.1 RES domain-containing protein [Xenorhabdus sp. ZM]MBD2820668.1 RES domain-containing protein [Xenorhabdus sp. 42]MBD2824088.1 RES domain-containing protein [Xenorhabdus sp. 5]